MNLELRAKQQQGGALFTAETPVPMTFDNDDLALEAARTGLAMSDRSHCGLLELTGEDRLNFLHNQTTNDLKRLRPRWGCQTVFVTSTARTIDLATAYATETAVLLRVSPQQAAPLLAWMDRYIFPMDRVQAKDISADYAIFNLLGSESHALVQNLDASAIAEEPEHSHQLLKIDDIPVRVALGSGLALPGYTLIVAAEKAADLWEYLINSGAIPMGDRAWERLRIEQGCPVPGRELTEDYNPLEAGLWSSVSFQKGCYIGQETIARLNTYRGVKQRLWGVKLSAFVAADTPALLDEKTVGKLTSVVETETGAIGLAYIRTQAGGAGLTVRFGDVEGAIVPVPFLSHDYYQPGQDKG